MRLDALLELGGGLQLALDRIALALRGDATRRPGRRPVDVTSLTRLALVGFHGGSAVLEFELAEETRPFADLNIGERALAELVGGLDAIASERQPRESWDEGVLEAVERATRVLERGVETISFRTDGVGRPLAITVDRDARRRLLAMRSREPSRRYAEVVGRLLMADFAATREQARIHPPLARPPVKCTFRPEHEARILALLTRYVRVSGDAEFDDLGRLRSIELTEIDEAEPVAGARSFWESPALEELAAEQQVEPLDGLEDAAASFWPEGESVDDFLAAIESRT